RCHLVSDHRESSTDSGSSAPPHTQRFLQENVFLAIVGGWRRWVCVMRVGQTTDSGRGVFFRVASDRRNGDTVVRWMLGALGLLAHNVPISSCWLLTGILTHLLSCSGSIPAAYASGLQN